MKQNTVLVVATLIAAVSITLLSHSDATCNLCSDHGIACINETSFHICAGGQPRTGKVFTCPSNKICTDTNLKCENANSTTSAACEPVKGCGLCDEDKMFACTSRTTFVQCNGTTLTRNSNSCPLGFVCDSKSGEICKDECNRPEVLECDRDAAL